MLRGSRALLLAVLLSAGAPRRGAGCVLQGQDSGHCVPTAGIAALLPFCAPYVSLYPSACLPNEYPNFPNHTAKRKDAWVQAQVEQVIARRLAIENTNGQGFSLRAFGAAGWCLCVCPATAWGIRPGSSPLPVALTSFSLPPHPPASAPTLASALRGH